MLRKNVLVVLALYLCTPTIVCGETISQQVKYEFDAKTLLMKAVQQEDIVYIKYLFNNQSSDVYIKELNSLELYDKTPLMLAVETGNLEIAKILVDAGALPKITNSRGDGALQYAAKGGNPNMVSFLLKLGLKVNHKSKFGTTALMVACKYNQLKVVKFLLSQNIRANVNLIDIEGRNALFYAVQYNSFDVIGTLIQGGINVNHQNNEGLTALMESIVNRDMESVSLLLSQRAKLNISSKDGRTALSIVITDNNEQLMRYILKVDPMLLYQPINGKYPEDFAKIQGKHHLSKVILNYKVSVLSKKEIENLKSKKGRDAFFLLQKL